MEGCASSGASSGRAQLVLFKLSPCLFAGQAERGITALNSKNLRIAVLMVLDAVIVELGALFAIALRFDIRELPAEYMDYVLRSAPV